MTKARKREISKNKRRLLPTFSLAQAAEKEQFNKLLIILFLIYCLSFSTVPFTDTDDQLMLTSAAGFLEMGKFIAPSRFATKNFGGYQFGQASESGVVYSKYPFGYPLILVIFFPLAGFFNHVFGPVSAEVVLSFPSVLLLIGTAIVLWRSTLRLGLGSWTARMMALAFGLGSFAWGFVGTNYSETAQAFLAATTFYCLLSARQEPKYWKTYTLLGGLALGYGILVRPIFALIAPVLVLGALSGWIRLPFKTVILRTALYALPGLASSIYLLVTNLVLFGNITDFGYGSESFDAPGFLGLFGLLLGLEKGIIWYFPLFVAVPFGAWKLIKQDRSWAAGVLSAALLLHLIVISKWWGWEGGWAWGPRLLLPILPFAVLLAGGAISSLTSRRVTTALVILGIAINSLGITINRKAFVTIRSSVNAPFESARSLTGYLPGHLWLFCFAISDLFSSDSFENPLWKNPPWILAYPESVPPPYRNTEEPIWNPWPLRQFLPEALWKRGEKGYMRALLEIAIMRYEQGEIQRSLVLLDRGLEMDGRSADFLAAKGMVYYSTGNMIEALRYFDQSIRLDPMYELAYYGRGLVMEALGNTDAARQAYNQLLQTPEGTLNRKVVQDRLEKLKQ